MANADTIQQENSAAINKIRSLFVDPGFPAGPSDHAGIAGQSQNMKDGEA